jgi:VanZ family protein
MYTSILILLAVLPINRSESFLNDNYILTFRMDYIAHFAIFIPWTVIAWLFFFSFPAGMKMKITGWLLTGITVAAGTEFLQYFLPYRAFNINDMAANLTGILLGSILVLLWKLTGKRSSAATNDPSFPPSGESSGQAND